MHNWRSYLGGEPQVVESIPLFPRIDGDLSAADLTALEHDRFQYINGIYPDPPETLFQLWIDENFMLDEQRALGLPLEEFYEASVGLALLLMRKEIQGLNYLRNLRDLLKLRLSPDTPVLFFGPTSGGELEAIHDAGGWPVLISSGDPKWQHLAETRLLDDRVAFDTAERCMAHHAVLSPWLPDPERTVHEAYESLGKYGMLFHPPRTNLAVGHAVEGLGLRPADTHQTSVGAWFKPPYS